jgi:hypothetical protein
VHLHYYFKDVFICYVVHKAEYSLRESVLAQGREGRGFDSDPGRKKKKKKGLYSIS